MFYDRLTKDGFPHHKHTPMFLAKCSLWKENMRIRGMKQSTGSSQYSEYHKSPVGLPGMGEIQKSLSS